MNRKKGNGQKGKTRSKLCAYGGRTGKDEFTGGERECGRSRSEGKAAEECRLLAGGVDGDVSGWLINRPASTP